MTCEKQVGVKNILVIFRNCENGTVLGPLSHELADDVLPTWRTHEWVNEELTGGYTKRVYNNAKCEINLRRHLGVPLEDYQGRSSISLQVEYVNGIVMTARDGGVRGEEMSDTHQVNMSLSYTAIDEVLPPGALITG